MNVILNSIQCVKVQKVKIIHIIFSYLCASTVAPIESSSCDHKSMIDFDVKEYKSTEWENSKNHCLKDVHVVLDVCFTVSEIRKIYITFV